MVMKMMIEDTSFGKVKVGGKVYNHDIVIIPNRIIKRKKQISKSKHGTSHKFTKEEMKTYLNMIDRPIENVIVGTGQYGKLHLLDETKEMLREKGIEWTEMKTPDLVEQSFKFDRDKSIVILHVTC